MLNLNNSLMKRLLTIFSVVAAALSISSCRNAKGDYPGDAYMPDMYYSRAYETYGYNDVGGEYDSLKKRGITYNGMTVPGTVARGDMMPLHLSGDTVGLKTADALKNPLDALTIDPKGLKEAERLFLVNCAICHGPALDGNGPLYKGGDGPYPAKPAVLKDATAAKWTDGHIFHVITFGKGAMGSYASQLRPEQRWWVIKYIRSKQDAPAKDSTSTGGAATVTMANGGSTTGSTTRSKDSTTKKP